MTPRFRSALDVARDRAQYDLDAKPERWLAGPPFETIDIRPGRVLLFGAPPGAGKTTFALQLVSDILDRYPLLRCMVGNVETAPPVLLDKLLARFASVPLDAVMNREFLDDERRRIDAALADRADLLARLAFLDPPYSVPNLFAGMKGFDARLCVCDYVQRYTAGDKDDRARLDAVMGQVRTLADQGAAVIVISSVARQKNSRGSSTVTLQPPELVLRFFGGMVRIAGMMSVAPSLDPAVVVAFRSGTLTAEQAEAALPRDRAAAIFFLLQLSLTLGSPAPAGGAHTPSGTVPPYAKPAATPRRKKRGAVAGHPGAARPRPEHIDHRETHQLPACPACGGELTRTGRTRTRLVEDIPDDLRPEVTAHTIHRDWCPCCKKQVEPQVPDALPNCTLGNRTVVLSAWLHYGLGVTTRQIVDVFDGHLRLPITDGGLTQMWHRLAGVLTPWYEQIHRHCLDAGVLHADETGWRVEGRTWWLWCFTCADATYYLLDESRGHAALDEFFVEEFRGVLVTDFWAAYDAVGRTKQKCWPHLLRELKEVDNGSDAGGDWPDFAKRLRRVFGDAVRLELARGVTPSEEYDRRLSRLHARVVDLSIGDWSNPHARRLAKRLHRYGAELLTFVEFEGVPSSNNHAEREIRPAVLMRKASYGSQSERGAATRSILMSVCRTLKNRGLDPLQAVLDALRTYATTGALPPLPEKACSES